MLPKFFVFESILNNGDSIFINFSFFFILCISSSSISFISLFSKISYIIFSIFSFLIFFSIKNLSYSFSKKSGLNELGSIYKYWSKSNFILLR